MNEFVGSVLQEMVKPVANAMLIIIIALIYWGFKKLEARFGIGKHRELAFFFRNLRDLVTTLVVNRQVSAVKKLRRALADGKISKVEFETSLHELRDEVLEDIKQKIGKQGLKLILKNLGDPNDYLIKLIEEVLHVDVKPVFEVIGEAKKDLGKNSSGQPPSQE